MTAIRVIFDGKAFVPQDPVSLPARSEALVIVEDAVAQGKLDADVRAYYTAPSSGVAAADSEDEDWANATAPKSSRAWDED